MNDPIVSGGEEPWFVFARSPGRFRGQPVTWQGWFVLFGGVLGDVALGLIAGWLWYLTNNILWFIGYFALVFPLVLFLIFRVIRAKGREVPMGPPGARLFPRNPAS